MGNVVSKNRLPSGEVRFEIAIDKSEALQLGGRFKGIQLLSSSLCNQKTQIIELGINKSTKYFQIPDKLVIKSASRGRKKTKDKMRWSCQRLETPTQHIFIYVMRNLK